MSRPPSLEFMARHSCVQQLQSDGMADHILGLLETQCFTAVSETLLHQLVKYTPQRVTNRMIFALLPPHIKQLDLSKCTTVTLMGLVHLFKSCGHIQHLILNHCSQVMCPDIFTFMGLVKLPVTHLSLEHMGNLEDSMVHMLLHELPHLTNLNVSGNGKLTDEAFFLDHEDQLRKEILFSGTKSADFPFKYSLTSVDLSGCSQMTHVALLHLSSLCGPNLKHVDISWTGVKSTALLFLAGYSCVGAIQLLYAQEKAWETQGKKKSTGLFSEAKFLVSLTENLLKQYDYIQELKKAKKEADKLEAELHNVKVDSDITCDHDIPESGCDNIACENIACDGNSCYISCDEIVLEDKHSSPCDADKLPVSELCEPCDTATLGNESGAASDELVSGQDSIVSKEHVAGTVHKRCGANSDMISKTGEPTSDDFVRFQDSRDSTGHAAGAVTDVKHEVGGAKTDMISKTCEPVPGDSVSFQDSSGNTGHVADPVRDNIHAVCGDITDMISKTGAPVPGDYIRFQDNNGYTEHVADPVRDDIHEVCGVVTDMISETGAPVSGDFIRFKETGGNTEHVAEPVRDNTHEVCGDITDMISETSAPVPGDSVRFQDSSGNTEHVADPVVDSMLDISETTETISYDSETSDSVSDDDVRFQDTCVSTEHRSNPVIDKMDANSETSEPISEESKTTGPVSDDFEICKPMSDDSDMTDPMSDDSDMTDPISDDSEINEQVSVTETTELVSDDSMTAESVHNCCVTDTCAFGLSSIKCLACNIELIKAQLLQINKAKYVNKQSKDLPDHTDEQFTLVSMEDVSSSMDAHVNCRSHVNGETTVLSSMDANVNLISHVNGETTVLPSMDANVNLIRHVNGETTVSSCVDANVNCRSHAHSQTTGAVHLPTKEIMDMNITSSVLGQDIKADVANNNETGSLNLHTFSDCLRELEVSDESPIVSGEKIVLQNEETGSQNEQSDSKFEHKAQLIEKQDQTPVESELALLLNVESESAIFEELDEDLPIFPLFKSSLISLDITNIVMGDEGGFYLEKFFENNKRLQKFGISWRGLSGELIEKLLPSLAELKEVELVECSMLQSEGVMALGKGCRNLTKINLTGVDFFKDYGFGSICSLPCLRSVSVAGSQVSDISLYSLVETQARSLRELDLSWCEENITVKGINAVCENCTKLRSLNLRKCPVSDTSLRLLSQHCPKLRDLSIECVDDFSSNDTFSENGLIALAENLIHLHTIDISWNLTITDAAVAAILSRCMLLEVAIMNGIKTITVLPFLPIIAGYRSSEETATDTVEGNAPEQRETVCTRSIVYAPSLRVLELEYCDLVDEHQLLTIVKACNGSLSMTDYYGQDVCEESNN